ncbi:hypothetical protein [Streptomyces chartreusis]|uniref:DUF4034 domain-containing protein n=1 Tax=Streptomyces chartreusis TaxID=1969 RepID=A0A7H8TBF2_STRCX|nr:hypothetical protein [Streptomyces chartreusis]QKZ20841.1 hypothetical protein HUT05_27950 [Streptomyces chartreusis]
MPLFANKRPRPRLAPELDDAALGRVLRSILSARGSGPQDLAIAQIEQLLRETGTDWDRRCHRVAVLAQTAPALARGWRTERPQDPDALVLHAWAELATDPWTALATCRLAAAAHPSDPTPWVGALAALRLLGRPRAEIVPVWQGVIERDSWHREAHLQVLGYLSPEEQGSQAVLRDFLDDVTAVMPPNTPAACLPLTAAIRQYHRDLDGGGIRALGASRYWSQPPVASLLDQALAQWLPSGRLRHAAAIADLGLLAYALARAGRRGETAAVFSATSGLVTAWPWEHDGDPVERYTYWSRA